MMDAGNSGSLGRSGMRPVEMDSPEVRELRSVFAGERSGLDKLNDRVSVAASYLFNEEGILDGLPAPHFRSWLEGRSSLWETGSDVRRRKLNQWVSDRSNRVNLKARHIETAVKIINDKEFADPELKEKCVALVKAAGRLDGLRYILNQHNTLKDDRIGADIKTQFSAGVAQIPREADVYACLDALEKFDPDDMLGYVLEPAPGTKGELFIIKKPDPDKGRTSEMSQYMHHIVQSFHELEEARPQALEGILKNYTAYQKVKMMRLLVQLSLTHMQQRDTSAEGTYDLMNSYGDLASMISRYTDVQDPSEIADNPELRADMEKAKEELREFAALKETFLSTLQLAGGVEKAARMERFPKAADYLLGILVQKLDSPTEELRVGNSYGEFTFLGERPSFQDGEAFRFFATDSGELAMVSTVQGGGVFSNVGRTGAERTTGQTGIGKNFENRRQAAQRALGDFLEENDRYQESDLVLYGFGKGAGPLQQFAYEQVLHTDKNVVCLSMGTHKWLPAINPAAALGLPKDKEKNILALDVKLAQDHYATGQSFIGAGIAGEAVIPSQRSEIPWAIAIPTYCQNLGLLEGPHQRGVYIGNLPQDLKAMRGLVALEQCSGTLQAEEMDASTALEELKGQFFGVLEEEEEGSAGFEGAGKGELDSSEVEDAALDVEGTEKKSLQTILREVKRGSGLDSKEQVAKRFSFRLLSAAMDRVSELLKDPDANAGELREVREFFQLLETLPPERLDWKKRDKGRPFGLMGILLGNHPDIQNWLSPPLKRLVEAGPEPGREREHQFAVTQEKARLCARFGYGFQETGAGANGAKFIRDFEGKIFAVYKPIDPARGFSGAMVQVVKDHVGQARLLNNWEEAPQYAEVAARELDEAYGFDVAPLAAMLHFGRVTGGSLGAAKGGCILEFLSGYQELKDVKESFNARRGTYTEAELEMFQKLIVYDFLRGNLDGHDENIFVKTYPEDTVDATGQPHRAGELQDMKIIDGGNSFREHNPGKGSHGNCYAWRNLVIAREEFIPTVREFVAAMDEDDLRELFNHEESFWTEDARDRILERFAVLKNGVATGEIANPRDLGRIRRNRDHKPFLRTGGR